MKKYIVTIESEKKEDPLAGHRDHNCYLAGCIPYPKEERCTNCNGDKKYGEFKCQRCNGTGKEPRKCVCHEPEKHGHWTDCKEPRKEEIKLEGSTSITAIDYIFELNSKLSRYKEVMQKVADAWDKKGVMPSYHEVQQMKLVRDWPTLYKAIQSVRTALAEELQGVSPTTNSAPRDAICEYCNGDYSVCNGYHPEGRTV